MKKGFTLIELVIAIFIVLILAIIGIPSLTHFLESSKLRSVSGLYAQNLRYAKSEAVKLNQSITVVFQAGTNWCYGITKNSTCDCTVIASCELGSFNYQQYPHTSLSLVGIATNAIVFTGVRGLTNVSNGSAIFSLASKNIKVSCGRIGNIRNCSDSVAGYPSC